MHRPRLRPGLYIGIVGSALLAAVPLHLRTQGLFACPGAGYSADTYVADCNAGAYGDYDHGAFWYDLEPRARQSAAAADVLFLGSSRMQFGLSTTTASNWFAQQGMRHYLLGFSDTGTAAFVAPIVARLDPRAKAMVINVDRFFDDRVSRPAQAILAEPTRAGWRYRLKRRWQELHRSVCSTIPSLCGGKTAVYRSRVDGSWQMFGAVNRWPVGVSDGPPVDRERWDDFAGIGRAFVAGLPVPQQCVLLTIVPTVATKRAEAEQIAAALGLPLIAPAVEGLQTFDGSHLDEPSAERWSAAFLEAAAPTLRACTSR